METKQFEVQFKEDNLYIIQTFKPSCCVGYVPSNQSDIYKYLETLFQTFGASGNGISCKLDFHPKYKTSAKISLSTELGDQMLKVVLIDTKTHTRNEIRDLCFPSRCGKCHDVSTDLDEEIAAELQAQENAKLGSSEYDLAQELASD